MGYRESNPIQNTCVDPERAKQLLVLNTWEGQRTLSKSKVDHYVNMMRTGQMRRVDIAIMNVNGYGSWLANGQHVLNAIIEYGNSFPVSIATYGCDTMRDAADLFATFDVHATRTQTQIIKSYKHTFDDERITSQPDRALSLCANAFWYIMNGCTFKKLSTSTPDKTLKPKLLISYPDDVAAVSKYCKGYFRKTAVVAAIIQTVRKVGAATAYTFWDAVDTGSMLRSCDPRYRLRETLINKSYRKMSTVNVYSRMDEEYRLCISAWNSWRAGKTIKNLRSTSTVDAL